MDENYTKDQRLFLETLDGSVEGTFHSIDPGHNKITLKKLVIHPSGRRLDGMYHYYRNEVLKIRVLEPCSYTGVNKENEAAGEWNLMRKPKTNVHSNKAIGKVTNTDVVMNIKPAYGSNRQDSGSRNENFTVEKYDELIKAAQHSVVIDRIADVYKKAMENINKEPVVGVHVEGARFGRRSKVSLLTIATPSQVFIFDIQTLGELGFKNGLRELLESKKVEKVIHNCRLVSDCLYHKHNVTLNHIFDTQVADITVTKQNCKEYPRCVRSLSECLSFYLHLPDSIIPKVQVRAGYIAMDSAKWMKRPLLIEHQAIVSKSSVFLVELRKKLYEEMMKPFHQAVNVFCNVVKNAEDFEASEHQANDKLVPMELLSLYDQHKENHK
ncbi:hypothetical protein L9F63_013750 [Diploptera punctata]|uniref:3'-5' exonuclease domain-containing protein n=1 Tax=Diploptera punctata TaxID=6984 RepID=A0AAD8A9H3_DIPPU|nr:hypothetical protein L9F63_013750 [Diploptera punctata]